MFVDILSNHERQVATIENQSLWLIFKALFFSFCFGWFLCLEKAGFVKIFFGWCLNAKISIRIKKNSEQNSSKTLIQGNMDGQRTKIEDIQNDLEAKEIEIANQ